MVDGVKCDFGFGTAAQFETEIEDVLVRLDLDLDKQLMIDGLRRGHTLFGHELVQKWIRRTDDYPVQLGDAMIRQHLSVRPIDVLRGMGAARGDRLFLMEEFIALQKRVLGMLFGLNREYHPGKLKGSPRAFDRLRFAPPNLLSRFESMFVNDLHEAVDEAERIVLETWDLIDEHRPGIDTSRAPQRFHIQLAADL